MTVASSTDLILDALDRYRAESRDIARSAKRWFEERAWEEARRGLAERLQLYGRVVKRLIVDLQEMLGDKALDKTLWHEVRACYSRAIAHRNDEEIAETFFNSVLRALFTTVGVDPDIEFVWFDNEILPSGDESPIYRAFFRTDSTRQVVRDVLTAYPFSRPYVNVELDSELIAKRIDEHLLGAWYHPDFESIEMLKPVFYRNKGAYLIGRLRRSSRVVPFIIALLSGEDGIFVDAVLLNEDDASTLFSFTRFYFFVDADRPSEVIGFLRTILPVKPLAELYIALGHTKHGKTVLYRQLHRHLLHSSDRFCLAPGEKGMVMTVFTLPSFERVFKVIRDAFDAPKNTSRREVMSRYRLVYENDRVGRLLDVQEFEHLAFDREYFEPALLEELARSASSSVKITEEHVIFAHLYTERRITPLNLYVDEAPPTRARAAVIEYGNAIRDLAAANIFPGDLLVKNFGVTRHGRVVFYDYDEICLLSECRFRPLPADEDGGLEPQGPSFYVGPNDVFPEQFRAFLWRKPELRALMDEAHGALFTVEFWRNMQTRIAAGELIDFYPYGEARRLRRRPDPASI
ncbi:MAG: bifunctional isocitrate dehydrogenase kinase/phosphatase [Deltaproteobacteria bacterium]|nr:bifunctional isocitrate dehydrogenase kinase/phosphatase [Deltaproteobacteria bacterium]